MFVFGGFRDYLVKDFCEVYDLIINIWIGILSVVVLSGYISVVSFKGYIYVFGCF